jgi:hypothetical protein
MLDEKTDASIASRFIEKALRALGTHRAWECPIHLGNRCGRPTNLAHDWADSISDTSV